MCELSIVIPHKNCTHLLGRLLKSIESEAMGVDVWVVDDGSSVSEKERLGAIREQFSGSLLNRYRFLDNEGLFAGGARNTGLRLADSRWVLFADSDDVFVSGWFGRVQEHFEVDADIVHFSPRSKREATKERARGVSSMVWLVEDFLRGEADAEALLRARWVVPWSKLMRLEFLRVHEIWFDEIYAANDVMFSVRAGVAASKVMATHQVIYCWMQQEDSLCQSHNLEKLKCRSAVSKAYNEYLQTAYPAAKLDWRCSGDYYYRLAKFSRFSNSDCRELLAWLKAIGIPWFVDCDGQLVECRMGAIVGK